MSSGYVTVFEQAAGEKRVKFKQLCDSPVSKSESPSPARYSPDARMMLKSAPAFTIGEKSANSLVSLTREQAEALLDQSLPAPCAYDPRDIVKSKSAGFSIGQR